MHPREAVVMVDVSAGVYLEILRNLRRVGSRGEGGVLISGTDTVALS
jgi:hypothetical protein